MQNTEEIWRLVDAKKDDFEALSDRVWGMPELCYGEFRSCAEHTAMLEQHGFHVTKDVTLTVEPDGICAPGPGSCPTIVPLSDVWIW